MDRSDRFCPISNRQHQAQHFSSQKLTLFPGLSNHTIIQRETTVTSVTDTTSIFHSNFKCGVNPIPAQVLSETIGGVSATAAPVANSSSR